MAAILTKATYTTEGFIPHLLVQHRGGVFDAPVKLELSGTGHVLTDRHATPTPMRRDGRLVFALPGCAEVLA